MTDNELNELKAQLAKLTPQVHAQLLRAMSKEAARIDELNQRVHRLLGGLHQIEHAPYSTSSDELRRMARDIRTTETP